MPPGPPDIRTTRSPKNMGAERRTASTRSRAQPTLGKRADMTQNGGAVDLTCHSSDRSGHAKGPDHSTYTEPVFGTSICGEDTVAESRMDKTTELAVQVRSLADAQLGIVGE
ncbi:hypothetical protein PI125_g21944 [Phytophthora idaei]|nr:hypothetical protein PI125_g21944 [Phytophthora idaei]